MTRTISLVPEEWDFRSIGDSELVTALEYEYTRSHRELRGVILDWHDAAFRLNKLVRLEDSSFARVVRGKLEGRPLLKNVDAIRIVMDCVKEETKSENVSSFLSAIDFSFPVVVSKLNAQKIAGLFDVFPIAWLSIKALRGPEYLSRRYVPVQSAALQFQQKRVLKFPADLNLQRAKLIRLFRQWLDSNGQQASFENRRRPGQRALRKWFKRLAAYRIGGAGMTYYEAQEMIDRCLGEDSDAASLKVIPRYRQKNSWNDAIADVERSLRGNFISEIRA